MRGFAFVQFKNMCGAGRALNALNLKEIKGESETFYIAVSEKHFSWLTHPLWEIILKCCHYIDRSAGSS